MRTAIVVLVLVAALDPLPVFVKHLRACRPARTIKEEFIEKERDLLSRYPFEELGQFYTHTADRVHEGCLMAALQHTGEHSRICKLATHWTGGNMLARIFAPKDYVEYAIALVVLSVCIALGYFLLQTCVITGARERLRLKELDLAMQRQQGKHERTLAKQSNKAVKEAKVATTDSLVKEALRHRFGPVEAASADF
jgi:hypothetical protein